MVSTARIKLVDGGFRLYEGHPISNGNGSEYIYFAISKDAMSEGFPATGIVSAISDGNSKISLNNVTGNWATGDKIVGDNEITQSAPDPDSLQFVSSVPESANGEVQNWSLATWNVSGQTETKAIVPGEQQTLDVGNDINLLEGTNYSVTVQYDADDADPVTSDPSLFKTSGENINGAFGRFSATPYSGAGGPQTIKHGLPSGAKLFWVKYLSGSDNHYIVDSKRSNLNASQGFWCDLATNASYGEQTTRAWGVNGVQDEAATYTLNNDNQQVNSGGGSYVSWNFAVGEGFFDIQKYNGNGSSTQVVSHEMNAVPAMMIVKRIDTSDEWIVYHKNLGGSSWLTLNSDTAKKDGDTRWGGQNPSSTDFTVGGDASVNSNGGQYIAYLFANNKEKQCFVGRTTESVVSCGWKPGWVMVKASDRTSSGISLIVDDQKLSQSELTHLMQKVLITGSLSKKMVLLAVDLMVIITFSLLLQKV